MRQLILLAAALPCFAACSGSGDDGLEQPDGSYNCADEPRGEAFTVGLEKQGKGGKLDFQLMSIDPAPALYGDNTWVVQVNSMASGVVGSPMTGATINLTSYMPDHMHTSPIEPEVTEMSGGQYKLDPVFFQMPGVWETTIIATAGTTTDSATYTFCLPH